jgi:hypothetical protein
MWKKVAAIGLLVILMVSFAIPERRVTAAAGKTTVGDFITMLEDADDRIVIKTNLKRNKKLILQDACVLLVKAYESLYGKKISKTETNFIIKNRIYESGRIPSKRIKWMAKAYAYGLISGEKTADYSALRLFKPKAKCSRSACRKMIDRLLHENSRYKLTSDFQMLRISQKNRPKLEKLYPYILDSFPNGYYDCMFNFMVHQAKVFEAKDSPLWNARGCTDYCKVMTWDTTFSKLTFEDRLGIICDYDDDDRLKVYCAYLTPAEYDAGAAGRNKVTGYLGMAMNSERKQAMADTAEEYAMRVLNIDYRTIADDIEWQEYMLKNGIDRSDIDRYIKECIEDELIIECDMTAADISGIYFDKTPFTFSRSEGVVRTYAHYRVVSDNGKAFPFDELTISNGAGTQCLRNTVVSDDGYMFVWDPCNEWQDGYFDIGMESDTEVNAAVFDVMRYKAVYIEAFGYPCETPSYYRGTYTVEGALKYRKTNRTREQYMEEWGYLYCR